MTAFAFVYSFPLVGSQNIEPRAVEEAGAWASSEPKMGGKEQRKEQGEQQEEQEDQRYVRLTLDIKISHNPPFA